MKLTKRFNDMTETVTARISARALMHNLGISLNDAVFIERAINCHEEMLVALKGLMNYVDATVIGHDPSIAKARRAIARAEGK